MTTSLTRRSASLQFQVNYTFSRTIDTCTDFNNDFMPFRPTRLGLERGLSAFSIKHNFVGSAVYATPFKPGSDSTWSHLFGDMTISPIVSLRSGIPFTIRVPGMDNGTLGESLYARPWNAGRNTGLGANFYAMDLRLTKSFFIRRDSGMKVDLLVEGTNLFNHANFSAVNDVFPASTALTVGSQTIDLVNGPYDLRGIKGGNPSDPLSFKSAFDPRQVQFGLKFIF